MGWINLILNANNAEGAREAMRMSFDKHMRLRSSNDHTSYAGVLGALKTRHQLRGKPSDEVSLFPQIVPFVNMPHSEAREAIAEYAVLEERPADARVDWLRDRIVLAVRRLLNDPEALAVLFAAASRKVEWFKLLPPGMIDMEDLLRRQFPAETKEIEGSPRPQSPPR